MKQVQNCFEWNLKLCTFENVASVLAVVYVLLGRAVTEYRWGGSRNIPCMRHKFLVLTVKKWLKLVYIYGSYREIKSGVSLFLDHSVCILWQENHAIAKMTAGFAQYRPMSAVKIVSAKSADDCARISTLQSYHYSVVKLILKYSIWCDHGT